MISVWKSLEKQNEGGDTVPGTQSSHHFIQLSSLQIGHKLTSKDESYVDIQDFDVHTQISVHQLILPVYTTCFGGLAWLV